MSATTKTMERPTNQMKKRDSQIQRMTKGHLSTTSINFNIPAMEGVKEYVVGTHGEESWRCRILHTLHSHKVQVVLMSLLLLDVVILFIETFLIGHYPPCNIIERDCVACCPSSALAVSENNAGERFLAESSSTEPICAASYQDSTGYGSCDPNKYHTVHVIEMFLFALTITILGTFCVEVHLEMIAMGPFVFFRQIFYVLDYFIIIVSLTLELLFFFDHEELGLASISGLVVFARIWRFVRIGHGIIEVTSELTHRRYEDLLHYAEKLEAEMNKHNLPLPEPPKSLHREDSHESTGSA